MMGPPQEDQIKKPSAPSTSGNDGKSTSWLSIFILLESDHVSLDDKKIIR